MHDFPNYRFVKTENIRLPKGWSRIGCELLYEMHDLYSNDLVPRNLMIEGMHESYGKMVVDHNLANVPVVSNLVFGFCGMASKTCQDCGFYPARLHIRDAWVRTLCPTCAAMEGYALKVNSIRLLDNLRDLNRIRSSGTSCPEALQQRKTK